MRYFLFYSVLACGSLARRYLTWRLSNKSCTSGLVLFSRGMQLFRQILIPFHSIHSLDLPSRILHVAADTNDFHSYGTELPLSRLLTLVHSTRKPQAHIEFWRLDYIPQSAYATLVPFHVQFFGYATGGVEKSMANNRSEGTSTQHT